MNDVSLVSSADVDRKKNGPRGCGLCSERLFALLGALRTYTKPRRTQQYPP